MLEKLKVEKIRKLNTYNAIISSFKDIGYDIVDDIELVKFLDGICNLEELKNNLSSVAVLCSDEVLSKLESMNYIIKNDRREYIENALEKLSKEEKQSGIELPIILAEEEIECYKKDAMEHTKKEFNEIKNNSSDINCVFVGKGDGYISRITKSDIYREYSQSLPIIQLSITIEDDNETIERILYIQFSDATMGIDVKKGSLVNYDISLKEAIEILEIIKNDIDSLYIFKAYIDGTYDYEKKLIKQKIKELKTVKSLFPKDVSEYNQFLEKVYSIVNNKNPFFNFKKYETGIFNVIDNNKNNNDIDIRTYTNILFTTFNINFYLDNYEYLNNLIIEAIETNPNFEREKVLKIKK